VEVNNTLALIQSVSIKQAKKKNLPGLGVGAAGACERKRLARASLVVGQSARFGPLYSKYKIYIQKKSQSDLLFGMGWSNEQNVTPASEFDHNKKR
jgi:hypothetical protein